MIIILILNLFIQNDSLSLRNYVNSTNSRFVMKAFSNERVIIAEKESSSLYSVSFNEKQIDSYSFDVIINPISDILVAYDKSIQVLTEFQPSILRFDRLINLIETIKLPEEITDASSFYLLKSNHYLILSSEQKQIYNYSIKQQAIIETISGDSYSDFLLLNPLRWVNNLNQPAILDQKQLHQFNSVANYEKSLPLKHELSDWFSSDSLHIFLTRDQKLIFNDGLIKNNVLCFSYYDSVLFYLTRELNVVKFEID